jgi:hypothetical protein
VLLGSFFVVVVFVTLNQRANQMSDKDSIKRSEYYQRWLKRARKADAKEDRYKDRNTNASLTKDADDWYFQRFLVEERIVFREGWEYTLLGRWARRLRGKGKPPLTRTEEALVVEGAVAQVEAEIEAENAAAASPAKPRAAKGSHNAKARKKNR